MRRSKRLKLQESIAQEAVDYGIEDISEDVIEVKVKRKSKSETVQEASPSPTEFMELNYDCLHTILEELSVKDLCSISQTCKLLQMVSTSVFSLRNKDKQVTIEKYTEKGGSIQLVQQPADEEYIKFFGKHIQNVTLGRWFQIKKHMSALSKFYIDEKIAPIKMLKIDSWGRGLRVNTFGIQRNKELVKEVESLIIASTKVNGDLNECILQHMPQLKRLTLWKEVNEPEHSNDDDDDDWMARYYPKLEYFAWHLDRILPIDRIKIFFGFNPNVNFSLMANAQTTLLQLLNENIRVDELFFTFKSSANMAACFRDLENLCKQHLCRRFHLKFPDSVRNALGNHLNELISLGPYIEGLYFEKVDINDSLAKIIITLDNLKAMQLNIASNAKVLSRTPHLEELFCYWGVNSVNFKAYRDALFTYAGQAPSLRKIYMRNNSQPFEKFSFYDLDDERLERGDGNKLKIYFKTDQPSFVGKLNKVECDHHAIEVLRVETEHVHNPLITDYLTTVQLTQSAYLDYLHGRSSYW